jgi:hypothetical protein
MECPACIGSFWNGSAKVPRSVNDFAEAPTEKVDLVRSDRPQPSTSEIGIEQPSVRAKREAGNVHDVRALEVLGGADTPFRHQSSQTRSGRVKPGLEISDINDAGLFRQATLSLASSAWRPKGLSQTTA